MTVRVLNALALSVCSATACTARAPGPPPPVDCAAGDAYDFLPTGQTFEPASDGEPGWYSFGDCTVRGRNSTAVEPIEAGGRCGSTTALVLRSEGHNDWGSGFGTWEWAAAPQDATGYDGISFWLKNPGATEKGLRVGFGDSQTDPNGGTCVGGSDAGTGVEVPYGDAGQVCYVPFETDTDAGLPPRPDQCGNNFSRSLLTTSEWQLYLLPFDSFSQLAQPNRVDGPDLSAIHWMGFNVRKDARVELWIDDISFYRRKPAGL